jgi:quercetin dioxygenase-like cupin family protein
MTKHIGARSLLGVSLLAFTSFAQDTFKAVQLAPDELVWQDGAGGTQRATLAGSPTAPGLYAYRARFRAGFRNEPHSHPDDRIITVLAGTLRMGYGDRFDEGAMRVLPAGSVWTEPAGQTHYVRADEGEVVIQVVGIGPSSTLPAPADR